MDGSFWSAFWGAALGVVYTAAMISLVRAARGITLPPIEEKKPEVKAPARGIPVRPEDEQVASALSRRIILMLDATLPPESLVEAARALEEEAMVEESTVDYNDFVMEAWSRASKIAIAQLGDLARFKDASLVVRADKVVRSLHGLGRAVWRKADSPYAVLLGQAYEAAAQVVEDTLIAGWPTSDEEVRALAQLVAKREPKSSGAKPADPGSGSPVDGLRGKKGI